MERYSTSAIIREMQIKTRMRDHFTPIRLTVTKKMSVGEVVEKLDPFYCLGGNVQWYSCCGKQYGDSQKIKSRMTI